MLSLKFLMVLFLEVSAFILRSLLFSPFSAFLLALGRRCGHTSCPLCLLYLASFSSSWFVCFGKKVPRCRMGPRCTLLTALFGRIGFDVRQRGRRGGGRED
ncbi:hypothetical protein QOT17_015294 [Balamuthia mandrillaris]